MMMLFNVVVEWLCDESSSILFIIVRGYLIH